MFSGARPGQPPEFFGRAHIGFKMGNEGRNEHEIALRHLDIFSVVLAEVDTGAAAGFRLAMVMRQRTETRRVIFKSPAFETLKSSVPSIAFVQLRKGEMHMHSHCARTVYCIALFSYGPG
jgi:hypothetical protein